MIFSDSPLFDYFAVIGYNPAYGLRQERIAGFGGNDLSVPKSPLEATYQAQPIAHFPAERHGKPFPPEIISLAMPSGVKLYTEQNVPLEPSFHSFVNVREDGTKVYGCSLIFYEELRSLELRQQIFDAQLAYLRGFASSSNASIEATSELSRDVTHTQQMRKFTTHSLPRKLSTSRQKMFNNCNGKQEEVDQLAYYKNPSSPLFISKSMAIITPISVIYSTENLLHNLWLILRDNFFEEPIAFEDVLYWALHKIPLPPPGASINVDHSHFQMFVKRPMIGELPFFDYPIETLFGYLSIEKFLRLLTSFMLEKQILIVSKNSRTLMLVAECLSMLVYPFEWHMPYCPILPHTRPDFLDIPLPCLMGVCIESISDKLCKSNKCFLDIDNGKLEIPEDLPPFPRHQQFVSQINSLLKSFSEQTGAEEGTHGFYQRGLRFNALIRSIFLEHFASLFMSYENYLLNAGNENIAGNGRRHARIVRESSANFDKISFLADQPESVLPFLSGFLETQMFTSFIDAKILSIQNPSECGNTHIFDKKISTLRNPNPPSPIGDDSSSIKEGVTECMIVPPTPNGCQPNPKYNGILPTIEPAILELTHPAVGELTENKWMELDKKDDIQLENQQKQQLIMENCNEDGTNSPEKNAPMNLAHENWKFVEHLLKETKSKTKRILVAKMGKEAIHLGHGHVHMGISGVEENTLVAAFCDLLERIWSHGLKKKQGSALWSHIIAYHEWEKKNGRTNSRRSSSTNVDTSSPEMIANESPKTLSELINSIRRIAGTLDSPRSRDNSPHQNDDFNNSFSTNNWSQSLLRAANVICEKIAVPLNKEEMHEIHPEFNKLKEDKTRLPPRPPTQSNTLDQRRLFTPQLRRRNPEIIENSRISTKPPNNKSTDNRKEDLKNEKEEMQRETYRKFIYQGPLKAVNNQQQKGEARTGREPRTSRRMPRSASIQPNGTKKNLASHMSEDSLSRMALSSAVEKTAPKQRKTRDLSSGPSQQYASTPTRQRNRSLSRSNSPSRLYERITRGMAASPESRTLTPLPNTMAYDLRNIIRMTEIKTDIGFARAFVRLALERKLLYHYLKKLLSNTQLLQKMYKRYSFLRCDDEREQFLFHLLSLNAVDFTCFTNTFLTIKMRYQVLFVGSLDRFPDQLVYIVLTGSMGSTSQIYLPANSTQFTFDFKNLGILSTIRTGHSTKDQSSQRLTKWYLDYVLVRNCVTAQTFYFRCGRWFGRGIDDGALERLLVAEAIVSRPTDHQEEDDTSSMGVVDPTRRSESPSSAISSASAFLSPRKSKYDAAANSTMEGTGRRHKSRSRWRSPSCDRKMSGDYEMQFGGRSIDGIAAMDHLQLLEHRTGMAVNALMKHFLGSSDRDQHGASAKLSTLLCADEGGLIPCIDEIFSHGLIQRLFQKSYPWDYVEKVFVWFNQYFRNGESKKLTPEQRSLIIYTYKMVQRIAGHNMVGKEGKFHLFVLLSLRDHILSGLIPLMAWTPITNQIYDQNAFLRQPTKLSYLAKLIGSLNEFQFSYEKSLTHGISF